MARAVLDVRALGVGDPRMLSRAFETSPATAPATTKPEQPGDDERHPPAVRGGEPAQ